MSAPAPRDARRRRKDAGRQPRGDADFPHIINIFQVHYCCNQLLNFKPRKVFFGISGTVFKFNFQDFKTGRTLFLFLHRINPTRIDLSIPGFNLYYYRQHTAERGIDSVLHYPGNLLNVPVFQIRGRSLIFTSPLARATPTIKGNAILAVILEEGCLLISRERQKGRNGLTSGKPDPSIWSG